MKKVLMLLVAAAVVVLGVLLFRSSPKLTEKAETDTTASIAQQLEGVDLEDLDKEFQSVDSDLNSL